ncbi:phage portal protein [Chitinimonas koreensis]|uniref:phage portal protein n=1 Tax=Chitinimonas koreensis TaxID=356302 RepID=UPI001FDF0A18|nr:phage portal protein [Chitinimonas koreensis]
MFAAGGAPRPAGGGGWVSSLVGGGGRSASGTFVTPESALALTAVQSCVTLLAESVAQLPCELYRREGVDGRRKATDHPVYDLVRNAPNPWQTAFQFREMAQGQLGLRGNAISLIERSPDGTPTALYPCQSDRVTVYVGPDRLPYYELVPGEGLVPQRMVHHVTWFSLNGYTGISPIGLHRDALGLALATEGHASSVFANGTNLSGVIERSKEAGAIKDQAVVDQLLKDWQSRYAGQGNTAKVALLQEGMSYRQLSMSNEDAQLILSRKFSVTDIARMYKVPPHMIGDLDRATFSNIEHQGIQYVIYTLLPWLKRHEQAMNRDLLSAGERADYYVEFNVGGLLRGDQKSRFEAYALGRQWGWLSVNDIRRLENLPPVAGGDTYLQPLNMVDANGKPVRPSDKPTDRMVKEIEDCVQ